MSLAAFGLTAAAAVLHAAWNLWAKRASGNVGVFWLALCLTGLVLAPAALVADPPPWDVAGLPCLVATGLIHAFYFALLAAAYRHGEMSVVYPLSRGTGVAGTALVAWAALGERMSASGAAGVACVCAGVLLLGLRGPRRQGGRAELLALLVGLAITAYSAVDKLGVGRLHPLVYAAGLSVATAAFLAPYALLARREQCQEAWRSRKRECLLVGLASVGTYLLVLCAFRLAPAGYVVAVRESSIAVAAALGAAVLREPFTLRKGVCVAAILCGVVVIKLG